MDQDYLIYKEGDEIIARGIIDQTKLSSSSSASSVIQAAIDSCRGGGEVKITRGTYRLDRTLELKNGLHLKGCGPATKLQVDRSCGEGIGIDASGKQNLTVSDFIICPVDGETVSCGIRFQSVGNSTISKVQAVNFESYGIWLRRECLLCRVENCTLAGNNQANLYFEEHYRGEFGDFVPNQIANCMIYGGGHGIECARTIVLNINACIVYQTAGHAFYLHRGSNSVLISGCRTFQITGSAVRAERSDELNISSNIFCWHTQTGIDVDGCCWGVISGNEIIDSGSYNSGAKDRDTLIENLPSDIELHSGIRLTNTRGFNINGNTLFNWQQALKMKWGIEESDDCLKNLITGNNINYFDRGAIHSHGADSIVANNVELADPPHHPIPPTQPAFAQSFRPGETLKFIQQCYGR